MDAFINNSRDASAFSLVDLAIRENLFEPLLENFFKALNLQVPTVVASHHDLDGTQPYEIIRFRDELINDLSDLISFEEEGCFLETYLNLIGNLEPELVEGVSISDIACVLSDLLENAISLPYEGLPKYPTNQCNQIYRAFPYLPLKSFSNYSLLLTPFYFLIHVPFWPPSASKVIHPFLKKVINRDPISLSGLGALLSKQGILVRLIFLKFIQLNDEHFAFVDENKSKVVLMEGVFNRFSLYAKNVDRKKYSHWELAYLTMPIETETADPLKSIKNPKPESLYVLSRFSVDLKYIKDLFIGKISDSSFSIDWTEIGAKMLITHDCPERKIQNLSAELHEAIVELLLERKVAMRRNEIKGALGFEIDLEPDMLPPGRIMAYATHTRFLNPDEAFYVLSDWVETETEKKGKIVRARIITPFKNKDINFSRNLLNSVVFSDPLFNKFGIITTHKIALEIAVRLPEKPTELYFLKLIREKVADEVKEEMVYVGLDYFLKKEFVLEKLSDEPMDEWRSRILKYLMGEPFDIKYSIQKLNDEYVKEELLHFIR